MVAKESQYSTIVDNDSGNFLDFFKLALIFLNYEDMRFLPSGSNPRILMISSVESLILKLCLFSNKAKSSRILGENSDRLFNITHQHFNDRHSFRITTLFIHMCI